ncbi:filamentous haemagglutinin family protein [Methylotenera sp.]|uniref:filamentous haemagglutinin family protein n=1 Tax=Methylotenera sp. TaxID=2051956 RepID=UPI002489C738|nr:filamentous haemagglutinin family protein [Methylotenera sp.]MDI1361107.1 filamentous hemagglutinin family protein [Methylotenera sp.]
MNFGRFRLVYSQYLNMFVPVSEATKSHGQKSSGKRIRSRHALAAAIFTIAYSYDALSADPLPSNALPTLGVITSGAGAINTNAAAMTINQSTKNMVINWGTFNIGSAANVNFDQQLGATSSVLNRVSASGGLSQIMGKLTANGQVYLINPNGILFGKGASVNVNSLIASTLNISDDLFNKGFLSLTDGSAAFSGDASGFIQVDLGATLTAASGGKIMMFAPNIENNGLISTPDGQTLLAAGQKVYLAASDNPNLRGLLVEVDNGGTTTNTNLGNIIAERGNITLAGIAVNQNGRVKATTSVTANGSIKIQAQDTTTTLLDPVKNVTTRFATKGGTAVLGENSITEVLLDATDKATVLDSATVNKSKVDISGQSIHLMKNAMIIAPSGNVGLFAGLNPNAPTILDSNSSAVANASRVYFDSGSVIDVSGVGSGSTVADRAGETAAQVSVASNVVQAELRSTQLRDSPLQRDGILNKAKVYVDARATGVNGNVGTSVADVSGYTSAIQHGVKERLATGGAVKVQSEGDIVFAPTATINVSGGKVDYTGGTVTKTRLLASNGQSYDIANASKDLKYVDIQNVSYQEQGYTSGKDAGSISFSAPAMVLEGKLKGDTISGIHQRTNLTKPKGATLQIGQNKANAADTELLKQTYVLHSDLILDASHVASALPAFGDDLSKEQQQTLLLGSNFTAPTGFNSLLYYADGQITVKSGTNLSVTPSGNVTLNGGGVDVQGNITAHSGTVDLSAKNREGYIGKQATFTNNAGSNVKVGSASTLDVSGLWTNDRVNPTATDTIAVDGGKINISASSETGAGDITLAKGSVVNASGGAWLNASGKLSSGKGGDIKLLASDGITDDKTTSHTGKLRLDGTLRADSLATGGSLSLSSGTVTIGTTALGTAGETLIDPTLFQNGGFTSYDINGFEGLTLADNTSIAPAALTRVLDSGFAIQQSGADITKFSHLSMLPASNAALTRKVTNLSLSASNQNTGKLTLGLGSIITTDPGASVNLLAKRQLTILGSILAPAGNISATLGTIGSSIGIVKDDSVDALKYKADQTLWLGANSVLDVSGVTNSYVNNNGFNVGNVKDAGNITLKATKGEVVAETGSQLKLNGTHAVLDVKSGNSYVAKDVASKGGNLSISAREGIMLDATMSAHGGNESVAAGNLSIALPLIADLQGLISSNGGLSPEEQYPTVSREIVLKATGSAVPVGLHTGDSIDASNNGIAYVFADKLQSAGFDTIQLAKSDKILIADSLTLKTRGAITLDTPNLVVNDGVDAVINASYVGIGNGQVLTQNVLNQHLTPAVAGTGTLTVNADYIDLFGQQNLSGIGNKDTSTGKGGANFNSTGDIQLRGVLKDIADDDATVPVTTPLGKLQTAGDLTLKAARIYPSTLSNYTLSSTGAGSTIAFKSSGADTGVPYSVLGKLNVEATNITQDGVLRAPFGVINLKASDTLTLGSNSLTSVSAEGKTLPIGYTVNGKDWTFDEGNGRVATISSLPDKNVNLDSKFIETKAGSKIDISGGGDLSAWEFTTGTGGSDDVLAASGVFAVMPDLKAGYMAGNSESYSNGTFKAGDSIYLSGGNGLPAGNYVLLPAHYALLPGAYSVKAVAGTQDFTAQQNTRNKDGSMIVSGYRTQFGGITADSRASGFIVASGAIARTQSEFSNTLASNYFNPANSTGQASGLRLPADAGRVAISAVNNLILDGSVIGKHSADSRGSEVDISSDKIAISGDGSQETGYLTLSSTKLNAMGAESLVIGGKRTSVAAGTQLDVTASNVKLIGGASLTGQEITLAATDTVSMVSGTSVNAAGAAVKNGSALIIGDVATGVSGDGALLRVSTGEQRDLVRKNVSQLTGNLDIQSGAKVSADGSIIADATNANHVNGDIAVGVVGKDGKRTDGAVRLGAPNISFGTPTTAVGGLLLDNDKLAALGNPSNIQLKSYSTIDFYGTTKVGNDKLKSLTLETAGFKGYNSASDTVTLTADTVKFANPDAATYDRSGTLGSGTLQVNAGKEIGLGNGTFSTAGFSKVNLKADQVVGQAKGTLDVTGDLNINAARITAAGLSDQTIKASGNLVTSKFVPTKDGVVTVLDKAPLGGKLTLAADTITHGGIIDMPSGTVTLKAEGSAGGDSLVLLSGSQINATGSAKMLGTVAGLADAGTINLQTTKGNIRMEAGAVLDVSATGGAGAGTVAINTAGIAALAGTLNGIAAVGNGVGLPKQGSFELNAKTVTDFKALNVELERGKFNESRNIHVAKGDLNVAVTDTVTAHNVTLTTDDGNLTVAGKIDATGNKGGIVKLNAGQQLDDGKGNIILESTALIDASANIAATETAGSKGDGGKVTLNTATDSDTSPSIGSRILAAIGSVIDVRGKGLGSDGKVVLRAPRLGMTDNTQAGNDIAITQFGSTVKGEKASIVAEGVKVYKNAAGEANVVVDSTFIASMLEDNANFLTNASGIKSTLGLASDARFKVSSGDEVRSTGDITVADDLDLHDGGPGALTLRARGDVKVNGSISAAFTTATTAGALTTGGTWDYRIAAGADLNSADVLATNNQGTGDFTLEANKLIRTGTGDIEIATGGNFKLDSATSVIYTAGELDNTDDYIASLGAFIKPTVVAAAYNTNGGDITLVSKGNIIGADTIQLPADWLFRQGLVSNGKYTSNTSWWTYFNNFQENIGALGGGDINIKAGGTINDLSAAIATNGRVFGSGPTDGKLVVNGGGDLNVQAGGDISGGVFMDDKGTATIRAGGGLLADTHSIKTVLALGDAVFDVASVGQLNLMTALNPTMIGMASKNLKKGAITGQNEFSTYGPDSAIKLTSVASGIEISNDVPPNDFSSTNSPFNLEYHLFPGTLEVIALAGDVAVNGRSPMVLMPALRGNLQLVTSDSLQLNAAIIVSDRDPLLLPTVLNPVSKAEFKEILNKISTTDSGSVDSLKHAATPLHQADSEPIVVYAGKDIEGLSTGTFSLLLPKKANIYAGNDINNFAIFGQNLNASDVTTISAGHDYSVGLNGVLWGGPGYLDISAGRNIDLNTSFGIVTRGNLDNPFLPEAGAGLSVLVGAAAADDKAFIAKYLDPAKSKSYSSNLTNFVRKVNGIDEAKNLSDADAWAQFQIMDTQLQHQFVQTTFFSELKQAGVDHNNGSGTYKRGFDAIATYFPNAKYDGKLDLAFSQLKTERGGDLNVMAPGGSIVIGLPKTPEALLVEKAKRATNPESILGMFTVKGGNINLFSKGNIDVAQSREFTIAGGDILNWSSEGDIDAGKGSKTATSAPPPLIRTDEKGNTVVDLSGVVSGSGIGTLQTLASAPLGNVYLIAPAGTVNAGDAGVRASGDIFVAANAVSNGDNFNAGGKSSGVPVASTGSISFNAPASADSTATTKQGDQLGAADKLGQNSKLAALPSVISVEVISLGDESTPAVKTEISTKSETSTKKDKDGKNKKD